jgi:uncharacterized protein YggT (Ycf19 family)
MTERETYTERSDTTTPMQREVHHERSVSDQVSVAPDARREVSRERVSGPDGTYEARREHVVVPSEADRRAATTARVQQVIAFIVGIIVVLLAIRFALFLLGANQASSFVQFVYTLTQPLTTPFQGIFGEPTFGASVFEWASLTAIIVYSLVGLGLRRLVDLVLRPARVPADDELLR